MKKEVSDHLARVFFENNRTKQKKSQKPLAWIWVASAIVLVFLGFVSVFLFSSPGKIFKAKARALKLENYGGPQVLKFDFSKDPAKTATLYVEFPDINLSGYKRLGFNVRFQNTDKWPKASLKVSLVNKRKEVSSLYIQNINHSWKKIVIPFSDFSQLRDWSNLCGFSFSLEPWNTDTKKGELLIDDIQFLDN